MAVSLNSVVGFNSKLQLRNRHVSTSGIRASSLKVTHFTSPSWIIGVRKPVNVKKWEFLVMVGDGDRVATETNDTGFENAETSISEDRPLPSNLPSMDSLSTNGKFETSVKEDLSSANLKSAPKRSAVREKLRAARVLSRNTEYKAAKSQFGSNVLEALRESDRGQKSPGLPEAPTNLFDDSKRGMPKKGLTFDFPGGADLFLIIFSFVFISTVMFATTYLVWKVGAIHFNEY